MKMKAFQFNWDRNMVQKKLPKDNDKHTGGNHGRKNLGEQGHREHYPIFFTNFLESCYFFM